MTNIELGHELKTYAETFERFMESNDLPPEWFAEPDHIAIKCADSMDYVATILMAQQSLSVIGLWEVTMDKRRLASAVLGSPLTAGKYSFTWLEVMEPRPGKELPRGFVEHTEFVFSDHEGVVSVLTDAGVPGVELQKNPGHAWVNIPIDERGREIKVNDKPLKQVIVEEEAKGISETLIQPPDDFLHNITRLKGHRK